MSKGLCPYCHTSIPDTFAKVTDPLDPVYSDQQWMHYYCYLKHTQPDYVTWMQGFTEPLKTRWISFHKAHTKQGKGLSQL